MRPAEPLPPLTRADDRPLTPDSAAQPRPSGGAGLAIALMLLSMFCFSANDAMGKWLVGVYTPAQVLVIRSLSALVVLAPLIVRDGWRTAFALQRPGVQIARVAFGSAEVYCFYASLRYLPLADAMSFYLAAPIFVAALSSILLGEQVGPRRWAAILAGFLGVVVALGPSFSASATGASLAIAGAVLFSLMTVSTRALGRTGDKVLVLWQMVGALLAGLVAAPFGWTPLAGRDALLLALLGVVAMGAHLCVNRSLKLATAATVAPYQYTLLVWAMLFGYLVFGDIPSVKMLCGAAIIVAAGLFVVARETRLGRAPPPALWD